MISVAYNIYTILGSIPFISKLHLKSIKDCWDNEVKIIAFGGRSIGTDKDFIKLLNKFSIEYKLFSRTSTNSILNQLMLITTISWIKFLLRIYLLPCMMIVF